MMLLFWRLAESEEVSSEVRRSVRRVGRVGWAEIAT